jgi:hypothetical protein
METKLELTRALEEADVSYSVLFKRIDLLHISGPALSYPLLVLTKNCGKQLVVLSLIRLVDATSSRQGVIQVHISYTSSQFCDSCS